MNSENIVLPIYVCADVSKSMEGGKLAAANAIMPAIMNALSVNPILADKVLFALLDFSDDAQVRMPLREVYGHQVIHRLTARGGTSFAAAFDLLRTEIDADITRLRAAGSVVHRPGVWFISDGEPTDPEPTWRQAFTALTSNPRYPNMIPCSVDQADPKLMATLAHPRSGRKAMPSYVMAPGHDPAQAISDLAHILVSSAVASGLSITNGQSGMVLPHRSELPDGIQEYDADLVR